MTLSVGAATDQLVTLATTAVTGITVNGDPVLVSDGQPDELAFGMFIIGLSQPPPENLGDTTGTRSWASLGALHLEEDYTIPCCIDVRVAGKVQKTARDLVEQVFNAFWTLFAADLTLAGALKGGRWAEIVNLTFTPANVGSTAEPGRRQLADFGVHCRNLTS